MQGLKEPPFCTLLDQALKSFMLHDEWFALLVWVWMCVCVWARVILYVVLQHTSSFFNCCDVLVFIFVYNRSFPRSDYLSQTFCLWFCVLLKILSDRFLQRLGSLQKIYFSHQLCTFPIDYVFILFPPPLYLGYSVFFWGSCILFYSLELNICVRYRK